MVPDKSRMILMIKHRLKRTLLFATMVAGLFGASAARALLVPQQDNVSYALTLVNVADVDGNTATVDPGVKLRVYVSIPRRDTTLSSYTVPLNAQPARLMARLHKGPATAFDGSLRLTQVAPLDADGDVLKNTFYPMPQSGETVNLAAVRRNSEENVATTPVKWSTYVTDGAAHDPARWEAIYETDAFAVTTSGTTKTTTNAMINSLLANEATYEWYAASRYGLSSATRISDIQDHGRKMDFTDARLWTAVTGKTEPTVSSTSRFGKVFEWVLSTMTGGWHIYHGVIQTSNDGQAGLQLLNIHGDDLARVESPLYPDGISTISFKARTSLTEEDEGKRTTLRVEASTGKGVAWTEVTTLTLTDAEQHFENIDIATKVPGAKLFRIVRNLPFDSEGDAESLVATIYGLRVRSTLPTVDAKAPVISMGSSYPYWNGTTKDPIKLSFTMQGGAVDEDKNPRAYTGTLQLRRRVDGEAAWYTLPTVQQEAAAAQTSATLDFTLTQESLSILNGSANVVDNAFFMDTASRVKGVLPGVYDVALSYKAMGSFAAGRSVIDQREEVSGSASYSQEEVNGVMLKTPYVLDVREQATTHRQLYAKVQYRSGTTDPSAPYTLETIDIPLLPSSKNAHTWRVDLSRVLRLEDETAEYAWGYQPLTGDPTLTPGTLSFWLYADPLEAGDPETVYGFDSPSNDPSVMPEPISIIPAITSTMKKGSAVPVVVDLSTVVASHILLEADFTNANAPQLRMGCSYWQDFNTWYAPSAEFTNTEFRENVKSVVADFDYNREVTSSGIITWPSGWIPDEGPLAETSTIRETFEATRDPKASGFFFTLPIYSEQERNYFASWGASHATADRTLLGTHNSGRYSVSRYLTFSESVEAVVRRDILRTENGTYMPDVQLRLNGDDEIFPGEKNAIQLKGVGKVSFKIGLSLPYNIMKTGYIVGKDSEHPTASVTGYGVKTRVSIEGNNQRAASGNSVSLYLESAANQGNKYELRVTEALLYDAPTTEGLKERPDESCFFELYKWTSGSDEPSRLTLNYGNKEVNSISRTSMELNGLTLQFHMGNDGKLHIAAGKGTTTAIGSSYSVQTDNGPYYLAFGSAECRPVFNTIQLVAEKAVSPAITNISYTVVNPVVGRASGTWAIESDTQNTNTVRLRRIPPNPAEGEIQVIADDGSTSSPPTKYAATVGTDMTVEMNVGVANATLVFTPSKGASVFIDDIVATSWCGNDVNRNGDHVPNDTDAGFSTMSTSGFAGVGIWVRPVDESQLTVAEDEYNGRQCALLQLSRRNLDMGALATMDGITHTHDSLALYSPYSVSGFGAISFQYMIPASAPVKTVALLLQYCSNTNMGNIHNSPDIRYTWQNASDPIYLSSTNGVWQTMSVAPRLKDLATGTISDLVGRHGKLRLVMVTEADGYVLANGADPYVYIDNFTVTDSAENVDASWTATNVKLASEPIDQLYWKDRQPVTEAGWVEESTFELKRALTPALLFNDTTAPNISSAVSELISPILDYGLGRLTFAARVINDSTDVSEKRDVPTRLYLYYSTKAAPSTWKPLTFVEVESELWETYDIDLSKFEETMLDAEGQPVAGVTGSPFNCEAVHQVKLCVALAGSSQDEWHAMTNPRKVMIDQIAFADPLLPSIRVKSVAFSNVVDGNMAPLDRNSPLSQPISQSPTLRAMVTLDQAQMIDETVAEGEPEKLRVFMTFDVQTLTDANTHLKKYTVESFDDGETYTYTDVNGNKVSASAEAPIYAWNTNSLEAWKLSSWFNLDEVTEKVLANPNAADFGVANTVELTRKAGTYNFFAQALHDLEVTVGGTKTKLTALPPNALVRYTAWVIYKSDTTDRRFVRTMDAGTYTDFPWYYPRSLNKEVQAQVLEKNPDVETLDDYFSPYYWVYSCAPGEVFINEINLQDATNPAPAMGQFVEVCAPTDVDLTGWWLDTTRDGSVRTEEYRAPFTQPRLTEVPEAGVVPAKTVIGSSAMRTFYTLFSVNNATNSALYYKDGATSKPAAFEPHANVGLAQGGWTTSTSGSGRAASVLLYRPTGGAEHIVVYVRGTSTNVSSANALTSLDNLYNHYKNGYINEGFASEWYQTFLDETWSDSVDPGDLATFSGLDSAKVHGRRLAKIDLYPSDGTTTENRYNPKSTSKVRAYDRDSTTGIVNSFATVDMGGFWVTRTNAVSVTDELEHGPADLSILFGAWPSTLNPTLMNSRLKDAGTPRSTNTAPSPYVQVTPRQINPGQYMFAYTGLEQSTVTSTITGLGTHMLETLNDDNTITGVPRYGGREDESWSVNATVTKAKVTYDAMPFQQLTALTYQMENVKAPGTPLTKAEVDALGMTYTSFDEATGIATVQVSGKSASLNVVLSKKDVGRFNVTLNATFEPIPNATDGIITKVAPYTGDGTAQPWWGANFGFEVEFDPAKLEGATLSSVIVTYPTPTGLKDETWANTGFDTATWSGSAMTETIPPAIEDAPSTTVPRTLDNQDLTEARRLINNVLLKSGLAYVVEMSNVVISGEGEARKGVVCDASVARIPGTAYATAMGFDETKPDTYALKEPAIPFCVWGVYTVTIQTPTGEEDYAFVMRQAGLNETTAPTELFTPGAQTVPMNTAKSMPYFYLYSTPPQSAWLNELDLTPNAQVEVVMPKLRAGILDGQVPTTTTGWKVQRYTAAGAADGTTNLWGAGLSAALPSGSDSYVYYTKALATDETAATAAYTLVRPCGAVEGGVWTGVGATAGDDGYGVPASVPTTLTENPWLLNKMTAPYVAHGVMDVVDGTGSIQLVGSTIVRPEMTTSMLSSDVAKRDTWKYYDQSTIGLLEGNGPFGVDPDYLPEWNQVTITSSLRNLVYSGTACGYQHVPGVFETALASGTSETVTQTLSGPSWKYTSGSTMVLSFRPRANYRFEKLTLPPDLIGRVMLIGADKALPAAEIATRVNDLRNRLADPDNPALDDPVRYTDWLAVNQNTTDGPLARAETLTEMVDGVETTSYTGVITFNPDFVLSNVDEPVLFGNVDTYVITLVFFDEPPGASNTIEMALGQGDVKSGAWMVTQSFYGLNDDDTPDTAKGGKVVTESPIWVDDEGVEWTKDGTTETEVVHASAHGWVYQPVVGDRLGMTAVINPQMGLLGGTMGGGTIETLKATFESATATTGTLRPMLIWSLIRKDKVPEDLASLTPSNTETYRNFMAQWDLANWAGVRRRLPTISESPIKLTELRTTLQEVNAGAQGRIYERAGIIPMVYMSTNDTNPDEPLFAFRTMTAAELANAQTNYPILGLTPEVDDPDTAGVDESALLLPFESCIDMRDETVWQEGAILRFAVVLVDMLGDDMYECQSISNFASEASDIYCPWYAPDATANVNARTQQDESGVSPYFWVYQVARDGVWLNELRPFGNKDNDGNTAPPAIELAMYPSPTTKENTYLLPKYSLDRWSIVTKIARMPSATAALEDPINWVTCQTTPLHNWIPYDRINPDYSTSTAVQNKLDFYLLATRVMEGAISLNLNAPGLDPLSDLEDATKVKTFQWLKCTPGKDSNGNTLSETELFFPTAKLKAFAEDEGILTSSGIVAGEVLYSICLVRNNGVVEDEVLFYRDYNTNYQSATQARIARAVDIETQNHCAAGEIRYLMMPLDTSIATAQFLKNETSDLLSWQKSSDEKYYNTLPGPNVYKTSITFSQPYIEMNLSATTSSIFNLSAQLVGGEGVLTLYRENSSVKEQEARNVYAAYAQGSAYTLELPAVNSAWYRLDSVLQNGQPYTAAQPAVRFSMLNNTLSAQETVTINETLEADTDYTITFVYTPSAAVLNAQGDLISEDDGFLAWLLKQDPDAILKSTQADNVTASEKYWLGLDHAAVDASDVALTFTQFGFHQEPDQTVTNADGSTSTQTPAEQPLVAISLTKGDAPIETLTGDGALILLGKEHLEDEWQFVQRLYADDINGENELILKTSCRFFRALLLSTREANGWTN